MYWHCEEKIDLHHSWDLTLFSRSHSAWYKYVPEPFNWSALKLWRAVVLHEVLSKKNVFCAWICFLFHEKWQNIARNIVFFLIFLRTHPKLCKGLVWQNFKENTTEGEPSFSALSLALRSSHIFLQIFSINNLCGNRNLYCLFNFFAFPSSHSIRSDCCWSH